MRSTTTTILTLAILALSAPAGAAGYEGSSQRLADKWGDCRECLPPQVDAVILRPLALVGGLFGVAAFSAGLPFVAIADAGSLGDYFDATVGDSMRYVFVDPLGTH